MNLTKFFITITAFLTMLFASISIAPAPVYAQSNQCPNPGPYGICPPRTDITIGDVTITDEMILVMGGTYLLGVALIANAQFIKGKLNLSQIKK
jgi:hypothetical protein